MDLFALVPEDDIVPFDTQDDQDDRSILCNSTQSLSNGYNEVLDGEAPPAVREYHQNRYVAIDRFQRQPINLIPRLTWCKNRETSIEESEPLALSEY
jgi:hypothetical protein